MRKVLIIEDDYDLGEIVEMSLSSKYQVLIKQDGTYLTEELERFMPDVMIIDNFIGQKNAREIIGEIRSSGFNLSIPIILFSAHHAIELLAKDIGATDFIAKPFNLSELHQCISRVLTPL